MGAASTIRFLLQALGLALATMLLGCNGFSSTARIGTLVNGQYDYQIVQLEPSSGETSLSNDWIKIRSTPSDLKVDENDCYCFNETDPRFSIIQAYYHGTKQLQYFDEALKRQNLPALKQVILTLKKAPRGTMPGGQTLGRTVTFFLSPHAPIDETLFAHEIGHVLHFSLVSDFIPTATVRQRIRMIGIREGMANILSALYTGETRIGVISYGDAYRDLNRYFSFPHQVFSLRDDLKRIRDSTFVEQNFPETYRQSFTDPLLKTIDLSMPEPYQSSSLFTQPLWLASEIFSRDEILDLIIQTARRYGLEKSYVQIGADLLRSAKNSGPSGLSDYLATALSDRGI